ncbi:MAG: polysaccharide deacetylase family protein [candidate division Zixibacteria bacterium]|nr:polysaccharide deacetylase family protein [candidate division Zixibacteria bacterium]
MRVLWRHIIPAIASAVIIPTALFGQVSMPTDTIKEICITLDDLPVARVHDPQMRMTITERLLNTLDKFGVSATGFVVGHNINEDENLLALWLTSGHTLGNHTFNHPDIAEVPLTLYLKDIEKGHDAIERLLTDAGQPRRYFRPPLLHYGATTAVKDSLAAYLVGHGYILAHVTIDNDDYLYNVQYEKLSAGTDSVNIPRLGQEYIEHIKKQMDAAETLAQKTAGRPVRQILLLHANRLNSRFLSDLLAMIKGKGYRFITLDSALADPIFRQPDPYIGPKGISFLERLASTSSPHQQDSLKPPGQ